MTYYDCECDNFEMTEGLDAFEMNEGIPGPGVPAGGSAGQILQKHSSADYDTEWTTPTGYVPAGGTVGQYLRKESSTDYDADWDTLTAGEVAFNKESGYVSGTVGRYLQLLDSEDVQYTYGGEKELGTVGETLDYLADKSVEIEEALDDLDDDLDVLRNTFNSQLVPAINTLAGFHIVTGGLWEADSRFNCEYFKVESGDQIFIDPSANGTGYTMLESINPVNGGTPDYATGYSQTYNAHKNEAITVPSDANYILYTTQSYTTDQKPKDITLNGFHMFNRMDEQVKEALDGKTWIDEATPFIYRSTNLFDKNSGDIITGKYIQGGNLNPDANYNVSGYIEIDESKNYAYPVYSYFGSTANRVSCYTEDKQYIDNALGTVTNNINVFTPLSGTKYVRVNVKATDMDSFMFVAGNTYPSAYTPYGLFVDAINTNSPLYGEKICCNGDSIMYGAAQGGVSNGGFITPIAAMYNMALQNIAVPGGTIVSGTTWEGGENKHWICDTMDDLDSDGDYYIFDGGVNDVNSSTPMGSVSWGYEAFLDNTTFCGAFEKCCKELVEGFPGKKYGFVFVHRIWQPTDQLASSFFDNQKAILKKWGIPYIDLMEECPSLNLITSLKNAYTNNQDGWHPNAEGYAKYYIPKIIAWLESL